MPKPSRGGKRSAPQSAFTLQNQAGTATQQQTQQMIQDLQNGDQIAYNNYMKLSDDEKADAMEEIFKNDVPNFLVTDSKAQKLLYYTDIEGAPEIVSDTALDKMKGKSFYRTVNDEYDRATDVGYTAKQVYNQVAKGVYTRLSGKGGSALGKGLYFTDDYYHSASGYGDGGAGRSVTMRMKFNSNARPVSVQTVDRGIRSAVSSGSKLGKLYKGMNQDDARAIWALNNGYNVINSGSTGWHDYQAVIDRKAITLSTRTTNASGTKWK